MLTYPLWRYGKSSLSTSNCRIFLIPSICWVYRWKKSIFIIKNSTNMKTSNILFILAIATAILGIRSTESLYTVTMTADNQPVNTISSLWLKMYDLKVTQELPTPVKHIKIRGNGNRVFLDFREQEESSLFSQDPQAFTYSIDFDTLVIDVLHDYTNIVLKQPTPVEQITIYQATVDANGFNQEKLAINAHDESHFSANRYNRKQIDN